MSKARASDQIHVQNDRAVSVESRHANDHMESAEVFFHIPPTELDNLVVNAKHALKNEYKLLQQRAQIEHAYAQALEHWVATTMKRMEENKDSFDVPDLMKSMVMILYEGEQTAKLHKEVAKKLAEGDSSPVEQIKNFRQSFFKHSKADLMSTKARTLHSFSDLLTRYSFFVADGAEKLKTAERVVARYQHSNTELPTEVTGAKKDVPDNSPNVSSIPDVGKKNITLTEKPSQNMTKSKNRNLIKLRLNVILRLRTINTIIENVTNWEICRMTLCTEMLKLSAEAVGKLGDYAHYSSRNALTSMMALVPEDYMKMWLENHMQILSADIKATTVTFLKATPKSVSERVTTPKLAIPLKHNKSFMPVNSAVQAVKPSLTRAEDETVEINPTVYSVITRRSVEKARGGFTSSEKALGAVQSANLPLNRFMVPQQHGADSSPLVNVLLRTKEQSRLVNQDEQRGNSALEALKALDSCLNKFDSSKQVKLPCGVEATSTTGGHKSLEGAVDNVVTQPSVQDSTNAGFDTSRQSVDRRFRAANKSATGVVMDDNVMENQKLVLHELKGRVSKNTSESGVSDASKTSQSGRTDASERIESGVADASNTQSGATCRSEAQELTRPPSEGDMRNPQSLHAVHSSTSDMNFPNTIHRIKAQPDSQAQTKPDIDHRNWLGEFLVYSETSDMDFQAARTAMEDYMDVTFDISDTDVTCIMHETGVCSVRTSDVSVSRSFSQPAVYKITSPKSEAVANTGTARLTEEKSAQVLVSSSLSTPRDDVIGSGEGDTDGSIPLSDDNTGLPSSTSTANSVGCRSEKAVNTAAIAATLKLSSPVTGVIGVCHTSDTKIAQVKSQEVNVPRRGQSGNITVEDMTSMKVASISNEYVMLSGKSEVISRNILGEEVPFAAVGLAAAHEFDADGVATDQTYSNVLEENITKAASSCTPDKSLSAATTSAIPVAPMSTQSCIHDNGSELVRDPSNIPEIKSGVDVGASRHDSHNPTWMTSMQVESTRSGPGIAFVNSPSPSRPESTLETSAILSGCGIEADAVPQVGACGNTGSSNSIKTGSSRRGSLSAGVNNGGGGASGECLSDQYVDNCKSEESTFTQEPIGISDVLMASNSLHTSSLAAIGVIQDNVEHVESHKNVDVLAGSNSLHTSSLGAIGVIQDVIVGHIESQKNVDHVNGSDIAIQMNKSVDHGAFSAAVGETSLAENNIAVKYQMVGRKSDGDNGALLYPVEQVPDLKEFGYIKDADRCDIEQALVVGYSVDKSDTTAKLENIQTYEAEHEKCELDQMSLEAKKQSELEQVGLGEKKRSELEQVEIKEKKRSALDQIDVKETKRSKLEQVDLEEKKNSELDRVDVMEKARSELQQVGFEVPKRSLLQQSYLGQQKKSDAEQVDIEEKKWSVLDRVGVKERIQSEPEQVGTKRNKCELKQASSTKQLDSTASEAGRKERMSSEIRRGREAVGNFRTSLTSTHYSSPKQDAVSSTQVRSREDPSKTYATSMERPASGNMTVSSSKSAAVNAGQMSSKAGFLPATNSRTFPVSVRSRDTVDNTSFYNMLDDSNSCVQIVSETSTPTGQSMANEPSKSAKTSTLKLGRPGPGSATDAVLTIVNSMSNTPGDSPTARGRSLVFALPDDHPMRSISGNVNKMIVYAVADLLEPLGPEFLTFRRGQKIKMTRTDPATGIGWGQIDSSSFFGKNAQGKFPLYMVSLRDPDEETFL